MRSEQRDSEQRIESCPANLAAPRRWSVYCSKANNRSSFILYTPDIARLQVSQFGTNESWLLRKGKQLSP